MVVLNYSHKLNGFTDLALTRLDIMHDIDPIKVCTGYEIDGQLTDNYPG